ncbi:DUF6174 domain-containing protein [Streptomyces djakartensis]|uniref:Uncharacterized protein n=1 Tax=Streptomyces djakartensis TaxID=68193 RepID=A0ABQ3A9T4_9ACTN|nr:DUF6174 domain-containing protein [Streptomyces djakartensis]GGY41150.1 hypothetical protein GCM10010384_55160 [Streptomyces djakartensis]
MTDDQRTPRADVRSSRVRCGLVQHRTPWQEPASYAYTLRSSGGERALLGTLRISVRDGAVVKAVGLDDTGRRSVEGSADAVPSIGQLLGELEQARRDDAETAEAQYAKDGHPVRISLDREENAVDDEVRYDISGYQPAGDQGRGHHGAGSARGGAHPEGDQRERERHLWP